MFGLDERIAGLSAGGSLLVIVGVAILLGLRHATDPDHLTAVSVLVASDHERTIRRAGLLGLAWGLGHATTLSLFGVPVVLFQSYLPDALQRGAEFGVGLVIVALGVRLLLRWRQGRFHAHVHLHGRAAHTHGHAHEGHPGRDGHAHTHRPARSPAGAYAIGLVHGMGGTAGVGVLLLAAIPSHAQGLLALALFAVCTAVSMAAVSLGLGYALARGAMRFRLAGLAPAAGFLSISFGAWYALGALGAVPYFL